MQKKVKIFSVFSTIILSALLCPIFKAQRVSTQINIEKHESSINRNYTKIDIPNADDNTITNQLFFFGFDKPLNSSYESFFITNSLDKDIVGLDLEIEYLTTDSLPLHKRVVNIECNLRKKETKRVDIKSWDKQKSFYFHKNSKPRKQATPFIVGFRLISYYIATNMQTNSN